MFWLNLITSIWHLEFYHLEFHLSLAMQIILLFPLKISSCVKWMSQRAWLLSLHELGYVFNAVVIPGSWNQGLQCNPSPLNAKRLCIFITTPGCGWCNHLRRKNGGIECADRALYRQEREMCVCVCVHVFGGWGELVGPQILKFYIVIISLIRTWSRIQNSTQVSTRWIPVAKLTEALFRGRNRAW